METANVIGKILGYAIVAALIYGGFKLISQLGKKKSDKDAE